MPLINQSLEQSLLTRSLLYGPGGVKKTWWIGTAAEAGFNVIYLDSDANAGILKNLSPAAQQRLYHIDISDTQNGAVAAEFMSWFCRFKNFYWDESAKKRVFKPNENTIQLDWSRFNSTTVVAVDSLTALVWSVVMRFCIENNIDPTDAEKSEWDEYRWCGKLLTYMLTQLRKLPCHLIVVGHQHIYERLKKDSKSKKMVVDWTRMQVKSVSGPHGMQIPKLFSEIMYFSAVGSNIYIDTRTANDRDGSSKLIPPDRVRWEDLSFGEFCKQADIIVPTTTESIVDLLKCEIDDKLNSSTQPAPIQANKKGETNKVQLNQSVRPNRIKSLKR